jgi:uncharacterized NAD(P)/FAD-binding protein YdhS
MPGEAQPTVVIIGGGFSGAAVAWHLARRTKAHALRIIVVETRAELGRGLAYGTPDPDHRLNVPEHKMSLDTADPLHFRRWLSSFDAPFLPAGSATLAGEVFAPRGVFGLYVARQLQPWLDSGRIVHLRSRANAAERAGAGYRITLEDGRSLQADHLVLAVSHPAPGVPGALRGLVGDPRLIPDAYAEGALAGIGAGERVLLIGSGLTGADVVATLHRQGHAAAVHMLSRHGRRSQPHGPRQAETTADFSRDPARTARGLLRRVRAELARDAQAGLSWHAVFDRLRAQGPQIWAALPQPERKRLVRHLRGLWDIHRFRIAPQTHALLNRQIAGRHVHPVAGRIVGLRPHPLGVAVTVALRDGGQQEIDTDRIVLATGPAHERAISGNPVLAALSAAGELAPDPLGLGLHATPEAAAIGADGLARERLLIAGPLARGAVGELMGLPEVTAWAEAIARRLSATVAGQDEAAA